MKIDLSPYADKRICVAVSGGKDSMALLHYIKTCGGEFGVTLSALNCDHGIRGEASERDSAFVAAYCGGNNIPLYSFKAEKAAFKDENSARSWRLDCYQSVLDSGKVDLIATAHHLNDNAETVLFNLARGTALAGMTGVTDRPELGIVRPLIACTREEIDGYVERNNIPFVTDESNFTDDYTRNKIRHNVLPALEEAVRGAAVNIFRFSRLAAEDEEYFSRKVGEVMRMRAGRGFMIAHCEERVIFKRAAVTVIAKRYGKKDYTAEQLERLFALQSAQNGKRFEFLGLVAVKEAGGVAISEGTETGEPREVQFKDNLATESMTEYGGTLACAESAEYEEEVLKRIASTYPQPVKVLRFDIGKIADTAVIRFRKAGDRFTKFGGGTKSLSDFLTDKKVPQSLRDALPLVCDGSEVLMVGGVEISDKVKVTETTKRVGMFICSDPFKLG